VTDEHAPGGESGEPRAEAARLVAARLAAVGVHPGAADLRDLADGWPTLVAWYEELGRMLDETSEPLPRVGWEELPDAR
jgi:hypothetical protein